MCYCTIHLFGMQTVLTEMDNITPPEMLADQELEPVMSRLMEEIPKPTFVANDVSSLCLEEHLSVRIVVSKCTVKLCV